MADSAAISGDSKSVAQVPVSQLPKRKSEYLSVRTWAKPINRLRNASKRPKARFLMSSGKVKAEVSERPLEMEKLGLRGWRYDRPVREL